MMGAMRDDQKKPDSPIIPSSLCDFMSPSTLTGGGSVMRRERKNL
jgi:hypothetical protein